MSKRASGGRRKSRGSSEPEQLPLWKPRGGKRRRAGRKAGHVTAIGADLDDVAYRARAAAAHFDD